MNDRLVTLKRISRLHVIGYRQRGTNYFQFMDGERCLKTVCTYHKARTFAQGVSIGRDLGLRQAARIYLSALQRSK